ncbi:MAG: ABC-F family ATP-binding cassette domain-containing protein [Erysipelotrichaceae bacterium]|nr:ABC-F family ATP-binding cassette domain-containing protein [Erysipelotrichaceae bacterium]MDY5251797.1 ABC-F family ATP-binding cassette domain-containing protein [Erysipelotrichaceae bacterium]
MLYQINKGSKSFGANDVFKDIQFEIKNTEKIAIVGRNGCGKSTFLKCILQEEELDKGTIHQLSNTTIGYLSQNALVDKEISVQAEMNKVFAKIFDLQKEINEVELLMQSDTSEKVLNRYANLIERFEALNGYNYQAELETVFCRFGFEKSDLERKIKTFSGGQQTRIAFVKLLISKPDILLLDEPTNHLDLETIEWLEGYLKKYPKAVVLVSHDRMFLDDIVDVVYEIEYGMMKKYVGNYTAFVNQKKMDLERQMSAYNRQQKEIAHMEALIEKFRYKATKASFAQSKIKALDKMEKLEEVKQPDNKTFKAHFTPKTKGGKDVLIIDELAIGYDSKLCQLSLQIQANDKIAIIGPNGCGKSTLLKTLMGQLAPLAGSYLYGHQIETSYFDQQLAQISNENCVLEELWNQYPDMDRTSIRSVLGQFLFSADDVFKNVSVLSGGEKVRLALAKILLEHGNFLVLDEPTNHLDIVSKEALEEALNGYSGTILFVSHDRYFIKQIANKILVIENGQATLYPFGYQQYIDSKNGVVEETKTSNEKKEKPVRQKNMNIGKEIAKIEKMISEKENELEELRNLRFEPEYYHDFQKMNVLDEQIDDVHNEIENLMLKWEELSNMK